MDKPPMRLDEEGIPVLDSVVDPETLPAAAQPARAEPDLGDPQQIAQLLQQPAIQQMLDDLSEDLQKTITWKIESFLKEEISRLVHTAAEQSAPGLARDIHTQLQLALPDLLASLAAKDRR